MKWLLKDSEARTKWVTAGIILLIGAVWVSFALEDFPEKRARDPVLSALNDLSPNATVMINGQTRPKEPVLEAIRRVRFPSILI